MNSSAIIFAPELAARLNVPVEALYELATKGRLPFAITSASPRTLAIDASHFNLWKAAVDADGGNSE